MNDDQRRAPRIIRGQHVTCGDTVRLSVPAVRTARAATAAPLAVTDPPSAADLSSAAASRPAEAGVSELPRVELQRGPDGAIEAIDVICGCGQQLRLACHYSPETTSIQPPAGSQSAQERPS